MKECVEYNGEMFIAMRKRYYQSTGGHKTERFLHRRIWLDNNGPIPKGFHIHHKDGNWRNNSIENLQLVSASEHWRIHSEDRSARARKLWSDPEKAAALREHLDEVRDQTKAWHASPEGLAWHSVNGKAAWNNRQRVKLETPCAECGGEILTFFPKRAKFCGVICKRKNLNRRYALKAA